MLCLEENKVLIKACNDKLGSQVTGGGVYLSVLDIARIMGVGSVKVYSWIDSGVLRARKIKVGKNTRVRVTLDGFVDFLKNAQDYYNLSSADTRLLKSYTTKAIQRNSGLDIKDIPFWLQTKIDEDKLDRKSERKNWSTGEERLLLRLLDDGRTVEEVALKLGRTVNAVRLKYRGLKGDN